jgi:hypothetical protein
VWAVSFISPYAKSDINCLLSQMTVRMYTYCGMYYWAPIRLGRCKQTSTFVDVFTVGGVFCFIFGHCHNFIFVG